MCLKTQKKTQSINKPVGIIVGTSDGMTVGWAVIPVIGASVIPMGSLEGRSVGMAV